MNILKKTNDDEIRTFYIPKKPKTLVQIRNIISERESSISDLVALILKDTDLSSKILETINSPSFGLDKKIDSILNAVCFMGKHAINDISTAIFFKRSFSELSSCLSLERFWGDANDIAYAMAFINRNHSYRLSDEYSYSIGFFHDCGIPSFSNKFDDFKETLIVCNSEGCNSITLEVNKYKSNHAVVGYLIATYWHLPEDVCNIILHHHDSNFLNKTRNINEQYGFATLKLAEHLVHRNKRHCESPDWRHVRDNVLNLLNFDKNKFANLEKHYCALIL